MSKECICQNWCRDWEETPKGFSPSTHHPRCPAFEQIEFYKVEYDGSSVIVDNKGDVESFFEDGHDYTVTPIMLTQDQYDSLEEFQGF